MGENQIETNQEKIRLLYVPFQPLEWKENLTPEEAKEKIEELEDCLDEEDQSKEDIDEMKRKKKEYEKYLPPRLLPFFGYKFEYNQLARVLSNYDPTFNVLPSIKLQRNSLVEVLQNHGETEEDTEWRKVFQPGNGEGYVPYSYLQFLEVDEQIFEVQAIFDYTCQGEKGIYFRKGDVISVLDISNPAWPVGKIHDQVGVFPASYTQSLEKIYHCPTLQFPLMGRAICDYASSSPDDLAFNKGDIIEIIKEETGGWFVGKIVSGNIAQTGLIPSNYIERLDDSVSLPSPGKSTRSLTLSPPGMGHRKRVSFADSIDKPIYPHFLQNTETLTVSEFPLTIPEPFKKTSKSLDESPRLPESLSKHTEEITESLEQIPEPLESQDLVHDSQESITESNTFELLDEKINTEEHETSKEIDSILSLIDAKKKKNQEIQLELKITQERYTLVKEDGEKTLKEIDYQIQETEKVNFELKDELQSLRDKCAELEAEKRQLEQQKEEFQRQLEIFQLEEHSIQEKLSQSNKQLQELKNQCEEMKKEIEDKTSQMTDLKNKNEELRQEIEEILQEIDKQKEIYTKTFNDLSAQKEKLEKKIEEINLENDRLKQEQFSLLNALDEAFANQNNKQLEQEKSLLDREKQVEQLKREIKRLEGFHEKEKELTSLKVKLEQSSKTSDLLEFTLQQEKDQMSDMKRQKEESEKELTLAKDQIKDLEEQLQVCHEQKKNAIEGFELWLKLNCFIFYFVYLVFFILNQ